MPVTVLDLIVLAVVLISAVLAMVRGFVREVLSVASWVAAAAAAYFFYKPVVPYVQPYLEQKTVAVIVSAAAIFFIALIIASYITMKISDFVIDSRVGAIDRALGFIFGAVRGVLLVVIALLFFDWLVPKPPAWVAGARTKPFLTDIGQRLMAALPEDAEAAILKRLRGGDDAASEAGGEATPPAETGEKPLEDATPDGAVTAPPDPKYGNGERGAIDQLIENNANGQSPATPGD